MSCYHRGLIIIRRSGLSATLNSFLINQNGFDSNPQALRTSDWNQISRPSPDLSRKHWNKGNFITLCIIGVRYHQAAPLTIIKEEECPLSWSHILSLLSLSDINWLLNAKTAINSNIEHNIDLDIFHGLRSCSLFWSYIHVMRQNEPHWWCFALTVTTQLLSICNSGNKDGSGVGA